MGVMGNTVWLFEKQRAADWFALMRIDCRWQIRINTCQHSLHLSGVGGWSSYHNNVAISVATTKMQSMEFSLNAFQSDLILWKLWNCEICETRETCESCENCEDCESCETHETHESSESNDNGANFSCCDERANWTLHEI